MPSRSSRKSRGSRKSRSSRSSRKATCVLKCPAGYVVKEGYFKVPRSKSRKRMGKTMIPGMCVRK